MRWFINSCDRLKTETANEIKNDIEDYQRSLKPNYYVFEDISK